VNFDTTGYVSRAGLQVGEPLQRLIETEVAPGLGLDPQVFWSGLADLFERFRPENQRLLAERDRLQGEIDRWCERGPDALSDKAGYAQFLRQTGYLAPDPAPFKIDPKNIDDEIAVMAGPQLVVPSLNARFVLNAANARWGSLYDALYGSDAILPLDPAAGGYDPARGAEVIRWTKAFLDSIVPLAAGAHADAQGWRVEEGALQPVLANPEQFVGYRGQPSAPSAILLRHNNLHLELVIDPDHYVGRDDPAHLADVRVEAALSTIVDLEDSVAAVDAEDKAEAYANWLGLIRGDLEATFQSGERMVHRKLNPDRDYLGADGAKLTLPGRSLLLVRNVGHHMTTPAVRLADGAEAPEGILDAAVTSLIGLYDLRRQGRFVNSRAGSIYIVKPKMHGPAEARFTNELFGAVEDLLGLQRNTLKVGVMDEERRTSANLAACIHELRDRIFFVNTGFLDRTGDEIHTSMRAGPMVTKGEMKGADWLAAYEQRNVAIALACGFAGRGQIGKGMWAAPDRMGAMLTEKIAHPKAGATTAWVPSPTAATLHAVHYHQADPYRVHGSLAPLGADSSERLLTPPLSAGRNWSVEEIRHEVDNNAQSILGYVVRWVDLGVGCSKVPDLDDVALMEDRATLRISSQILANWLLHGVCTAAEVDASLLRMAAKVDAQNQGDPAYRPLARDPQHNEAFQAARALIFQGADQANGYTEPVLHAFRTQRKAREEPAS
jgi:malate synthase